RETDAHAARESGVDAHARADRFGHSPAACGARIRLGHESLRDRDATAWFFLEHSWTAIGEPRSRRVVSSALRLQRVASLCGGQSHRAQRARLRTGLDLESRWKAHRLGRSGGTVAIPRCAEKLIRAS